MDFKEEKRSKNSSCMVSLMRGRASEEMGVKSSETLRRPESQSWERMGSKLTACGWTTMSAKSALQVGVRWRCWKSPWCCVRRNC